MRGEFCEETNRNSALIAAVLGTHALLDEKATDSLYL